MNRAVVSVWVAESPCWWGLEAGTLAPVGLCLCPEPVPEVPTACGVLIITSSSFLPAGMGDLPGHQVESHAQPGLPSLPLTSTHGCGQAWCQRLACGFGGFGCEPRNVQAPGLGKRWRVHAPCLCAFTCDSAEASFLPATWACTSLPNVGTGKARCPRPVLFSATGGCPQVQEHH